MTETKNNETVLVLGATGKTGSRVAQRLTERGIEVRKASRPGFDWNDRSTWRAAVTGVGAAYLTYYPDLAFPGAAEAIRDFSKLAVDHGVRRLVLLSGRGEEEAVVSEQGVRDSGAEWTVVRASWFAQNFSEHFLLEPVLAGEIVLPAGQVTEPFIDVEDIVDVVVTALTADGHDAEVYELTGPRLLGFADAAAEIGKASGREIQYVPVSPAEFAAGAAEQGVPEEEIEGLTDLFSRVLDGRNESLTDDVEKVLGRPARDFSEYAAKAAATGVWNR
ncbi:NmrA family transcriptional regulator [Amycolatopsis roodepoortensis]|uniref:NmrA family transcriptional regulator n=1 Tax=Amycolatopsis roodepoortensis TaxID=700274 RepID=UPI00214AE8FF|nr:NmrA family transcriptional regulator [Amycolatopsis roodepoortensis]UUV32407.1 NmrA family transcriptional regulator [Amycolatopsis roodepoortensis]